MANINIDLTYKNIKQYIDGISTYTYKDLGTSNIKILYKKEGHKERAYLYDNNSSNIDLFAIKQSLRNLFSFVPGQSILDPEYGNTLYKYVYQKIDDITEAQIIRQLKKIITKYEPRIELNEIKINPNAQELSYDITIKYYIPNLGIFSSNIVTVSSSDGMSFN